MKIDDLVNEEFEEGVQRQYKRRPDLVPTHVGWKCKGICRRLEGASQKLPVDGTRRSVYARYSRCTTCDLYLPKHHIKGRNQCPCCNVMVRNRPRTIDPVMMNPYKKEVVRY